MIITTNRILLLLLSLIFVFPAFGQNISDLEKELSAAKNNKERMRLKYELAGQYIRTDIDKAARYVVDAYQIARKANNLQMMGDIAYLDGQIHLKRRDEDRAEARFKTALGNYKKSGDKDSAMECLGKLSTIAKNSRDYKNAYAYSLETIALISKGGTSSGGSSSGGSSADREKLVKLQNAMAKLGNENKQLEKEKIALKGEILELLEAKSKGKNLSKEEKAAIEKQKEELEKAKEALSEKDEEITTIIKEKENAVKKSEKELDAMSKEKLKKEVLLKQAQAEAEKQEAEYKQYLMGGALGASVLLGFGLTMFVRFQSKKKAAKELETKNKVIEEERERSDELLLNILPANIAQELKENGKAKAQKFEHVSVLFSDFKNFTKISETLTPERLVQELDHCFRGFDFIIKQYPDIEKIKTIGDAYMAASGLVDKKTIPLNMINAALEMQEFLDDLKQERMKKSLPYFEARIGIHTGPVVAGVVGVDKFAYDIWGDTVNIASRMESNCLEGRVNLSETTYNLVKYKFDCEYRGKIEAKNKGNVDMYYVKQAV